MSVIELFRKSEKYSVSSHDSIHLKKRINKLLTIEKEIREEIENINIKKERFREWTKSLGENNKVQEMFQQLDSQLSGLYEKLNTLKNLREKLDSLVSQSKLSIDTDKTATVEASRQVEPTSSVDKETIEESKAKATDSKDEQTSAAQKSIKESESLTKTKVLKKLLETKISTDTKPVDSVPQIKTEAFKETEVTVKATEVDTLAKSASKKIEPPIEKKVIEKANVPEEITDREIPVAAKSADSLKPFFEKALKESRVTKESLPTKARFKEESREPKKSSLTKTDRSETQRPKEPEPVKSKMSLQNRKTAGKTVVNRLMAEKLKAKSSKTESTQKEKDKEAESKPSKLIQKKSLSETNSDIQKRIPDKKEIAPSTKEFSTSDKASRISEKRSHKETDELLDRKKYSKNISPKLPPELLQKKYSKIPENQTDLKHPQGISPSSSEKEAKEEIKKEAFPKIQKIKSKFSLKKKKNSKEAHKAMEAGKETTKSSRQTTEATSKSNSVTQAKTNSIKKETAPKKRVVDDDVLYLGIDLGTSETTVAASNGTCETVLSVIGWPKDIISQKLLKKDKLFGLDALRNKLALKLYRPLEKGVIKDTDADLEAARELVKYVISLGNPGNYKKVYAVIGAPARSSFSNQQALVDAAREIVDAVMIISEPFAVAYGDGRIYNSLVIDIGAGTTDICTLKGTMPEEEDQLTLLKAGDYIDMKLVESIRNKIQGAQITKDMAKKWKEEFSFTMNPEKPAVVEVTIEGKPARVDITRDIKEGCESIIPEIITCVKKIIANFDPEFQNELKQNVILAGGGSLIRNIDKYFENKLRSLGAIKVSCVPDPIVAGAKGALSLAKDLTDDYWRAL